MKQLYIIGFLLFFSGLCGCYEDKRNYDYTETFEITIDSLKESYTLYALVDTLRISPEVSPVNAEYDFTGVYTRLMCRAMRRNWILLPRPGNWSTR